MNWRQNLLAVQMKAGKLFKLRTTVLPGSMRSFVIQEMFPLHRTPV
jgi:hypothetical protein